MASGVNTTHLMQLEMELYRELKYNAFVSQ